MKKNSEKIILGVASVIALGVAFLGYSKITAVEEDFSFSSNPTNKNDASIVGAADLASTISMLDTPLSSPTALVGEKKRPVDLFVGVSLLSRKPESGQDSPKSVDPMIDPPIHADIPNTWWLENQLKDDMFLSDGPSRDPDKDGFSNLDEYKAATNPNDVASYPELADKLEFVKYSSTPYFLWFTMALGPNQYEFKIAELPAAFENAAPVKQANFLRDAQIAYARTEEPVAPDSNIFENVPDKKWQAAAKTFQKNRFVLKKVQNKQVFNPQLNANVDVEFATIQDTKANKMDLFEIPRNPQDRAKTVRYDRSAVLNLNAAGETGKTFTVEENTTFALPSDAKEKNYLLKEVKKDQITIEYKSKKGEVMTRIIPLNP